ncbi:type II secretion system protein E [Kurthia zopfii]|uniref:Type II traffic warden ATPase n=1 Tax=Kurthia zopfii TaxID=1650 RepID=A0A8B4QBR7_9BACL|nr:ATPase, T2SS/T4P/T4SS family [Kurthia zopfii]PWI23996.1 type II secretion system protein GspE [Kurthia zopfii]TDR44248.1 type IV pilus assembly protein PilB [Kurthia zopfii]GEK29797.1 type II secretion system protein E [Kurthia zopfii]STX10146.1 Type II traffic warden ATPase [Kurthia zopfii]
MIQGRRRLGDLLVDAKVITEEQLQDALARKESGERLGDVLIRDHLVTEQTLIEVLEFQLGIPHVSLGQFPIDPDIIQLVPKEIAKRYLLVPLRKEKNKLFIAMADPMDYFAIEEVRMLTGFKVEPCIATKQDIYKTISKYYELQATMDAAMSDLIGDSEDENPDIVADDSPIVVLVNQIISDAVVQGASDIHFDPQDAEFRIRFRIDGVLKTERSLPKSMQNMVIARIKIMGNLNITENRLPQDGRIQIQAQMRAIDLRLSTLPTIYGEKVVMRVLDTKNAQISIEKLGLSQENLTRFQQLIVKPNGIVLITGPTGSGKSSTLSATLNSINNDGLNIITVEDPVEYQLEGVNQIQVKEEIGLTFATGLRSILRQDPDIVMVGEIRDTDTAQIATRASLTGHLVLSTLHTNSAIESIARLKDMGVEPYLITASLEGVVAQRLVRKVCRDCSTDREVTATELAVLREHQLTAMTMKSGRGCSACNNTGYKGRMAIHEVLAINEDMRTAILENKNRSALLTIAANSGFKTLMIDGLEKAIAGSTTVEEILRVVAD